MAEAISSFCVNHEISWIRNINQRHVLSVFTYFSDKGANLSMNDPIFLFVPTNDRENYLNRFENLVRESKTIALSRIKLTCNILHLCKDVERFLEWDWGKTPALFTSRGQNFAFDRDNDWFENRIDGNCLFDSIAQMFFPFHSNGDKTNFETACFTKYAVPFATYLRTKVARYERDNMFGWSQLRVNFESTGRDCEMEEDNWFPEGTAEAERAYKWQTAMAFRTEADRMRGDPKNITEWPDYMGTNKTYGGQIETITIAKFITQPDRDEISTNTTPLITYVRIPDEDDQPITTPQMHGTQWNFWIKNGGRHYRLRRFHPRFRLKLGDFAAFADFPPAEMREEYRKLEAIFKMWENQPIAPP